MICHERSFTTLSERTRDSHYAVVKCAHCSLIQLSLTPSVVDDQALYDAGLHITAVNDPTPLSAMRVKQAVDTRRRAAFVHARVPSRASLLDVGSGAGFFLQAMTQQGMTATGIEISKFSREIAERVTSARVLNINLLGGDTLRETFDVITLFHVLEHISDPIFFLKCLEPMLKPAGSIIVEVPNANDLMVEASAPYRAFYWQRPHLAYFTAKTLAMVVEKAQLNLREVVFNQRYGIMNSMHWFLNGQPQMEQPSFAVNNGYQWLEDFYKSHLIETGRSDTIMAVVSRAGSVHL